jgi:7 transmembrane receptor (Secretin family).
MYSSDFPYQEITTYDESMDDPFIMSLKEKSPVQITSFVITNLSLLGSLFTLLTFVLLKQTRRNMFCYLVLNIAIADLFSGAAGFLAFVNPEGNRTGCIWVAILRDFGIICSYFFTINIGWLIYYSVQKDVDVVSCKRKLKNGIIIGYITALIGAVAPYFTDSYCPKTGSSCWVDNDVLSWAIFWFLSEFFLPSIAVFIVTIYLFVKTSKVIKAQNELALVPNKSYKVLFSIPCIFLICNIPGTLFFFFCWSQSSATEGLRLANNMIRNGQGLLNTMMYSIAIVGGLLVERIKECMGRRRANRSHMVSLVNDGGNLVIY